MSRPLVASDTEAWARRARTILGTCSQLEVGVPGAMSTLDRHLVQVDGSVLGRAAVLAGPCLDRAGRGEASPRIRMLGVDLTPVPQPDRQRRTLELCGRVEIVEGGVPDRFREILRAAPDEEIARFVPQVVDLWEHAPGSTPGVAAVRVPLAAFQEGSFDPLGPWELEWLPHLDRYHRAALREVARDLGVPDDVRTHPLQVEPEGMVLRSYGGVVTDHSVPFPQVAACGCRAAEAVHAILAGARRRARRSSGR